MRQTLLLLLLLILYFSAEAGRISGTVTDTDGNPLPFASILIKNTTRGTTANSEGKYFIDLSPGSYTLICQYVGYVREEKQVTVGAENTTLHFRLPIQQTTLKEVIIQKGEDPAYEVIRQAIKKRNFYDQQVDSFSVEVYIKGLLRSRGFPKKFLGQKVEIDSSDGLDSAGRGILFLSESVTKVSYKRPDKIRFEVVSSRQSGGGLGLSFPFFINFYKNNVAVFSNTLNKRGFVSPIADNAIHYYRYKLEGTFFEDKKMVNRIQVTPRRKNEPLFTGYILITEDDWRIHSLDLFTTSEYQLELIDTLKVTQTHVPVNEEVWQTKSQVLYVAAKKFGFDIAGNFVNVYNNYDLDPGFAKKFFNRTIMKYDSAYNKKDSAYWEAVRPIPLEADEKRDYTFKDSISQAERDSLLSRINLDSLRKNQKPITLKGIVWTGTGRIFYSKKYSFSYRLQPLIRRLQYNTVEGVSIHLNQSLLISPKKWKTSIDIDWFSRYGISNAHLNSYADLTIRPKRTEFRMRNVKLSGGKRLSQFNHDNPIDEWTNTLYTLLRRENYMKVYENWFGSAEYSNRFENGLRWKMHAVFEDRLPVTNTTDFSFFRKNNVFLPNHPYELATMPFEKHQAFAASITLTYQPGQRYIEFPRYKLPVGSKWPTFELEYTKGMKNVFGSDVDYDKWKFSVSDNVNLKLRGEFRYRISIGGFLNDNAVQIPDLQHFNGNQTFYNTKYLNSFQLAPYYRYSTAARFYMLAHAEHHFNGLLTNKIPFLNKLKWNLVAGTNTFYVNNNNYYVEAFAGLENIFKLFRIDFVAAWQPGPGNTYGVRMGLGGLLGGNIRFD